MAEEEKHNNPVAELYAILKKELGDEYPLEFGGDPPKDLDELYSSFNKWESETYPKIWHEAYEYGEKAKAEGLPRECNLSDTKFVSGKTILKVWKSAWEQGYDGYKIPAEFRQVEEALNKLPLRPMNEEIT